MWQGRDATSVRLRLIASFQALRKETRSESAHVSARFGFRSAIVSTYSETGTPRIARSRLVGNEAAYPATS
jgi:hypothetical protein